MSNANNSKTTNSKSFMSSKTIAIMAMLCALSFVAKAVSNVFPVVSGFLSFDLKDVIIVIGGFISGPVAALAVAVVVSLIEMVTISSTGIIGFIMNVLSSCSFACIASYIYKKDRSMKGAITGLVAGVLCMTVVMVLWNWLITPLYMKVPRNVVVGMLLPVFLPFNLVKGGINAALAMLLYKPVVNALRRAKLIEPSKSGNRGAKTGVMIVTLVLLVTFILCALVLGGVI